MKQGGGIIYMAVNVVTNKRYIGQTTKSLKERINSHLKECRYNRNNNYFHNALRKYGENAFEWHIVCECESKKELDLMESNNIILHNSRKPNGYNITEGGGGIVGYKHTEETKRLISSLNSGNKHWNYGKHWKEEIKRKNSNTQKGRTLTEEHKKKMSLGLKGKTLGRKMTLETREKMHLAKMNGIYDGKKNPNARTYKITDTIANKTEIVLCLKDWCKTQGVPYDSARFSIDRSLYKKQYIIEKC